MAAVNTPDDRSSALHLPLDPPRFAIPGDIDQVVQVPNSVLDTELVEGAKFAAEHASPVLNASRGPSLSANPDQVSDAASVHSMPAVHISESPPLNDQRPSTASPGLSAPQLPDRPASAVPPTSPNPQQETSTLSQQQRRARHRSAIEVRSSNRLSGFFNNLIHRRDALPNLSAREAISEDQSAAKLSTDKTSRSSSPSPIPTITPPPPLPPPSLQELGLSLSALTSDLAPAHFTTPPTSGTFLAPHYLLLCHAQGLDVLPLVSPPAPQPYALVRRVAFKSAVVMEHRGVLVAIAGRRDGVRVYALEEVKKAIEWRIDVEIRRERERLRREAAKKNTLRSESDIRDPGEKVRKASLSTPPPMISLNARVLRKGSHGNLSSTPSPPLPLIPRAPRTPTRKSRLPSLRIPPPPAPQEPPLDQPPPYPSPTDAQPPPFLRSQPSALSVRARARSNSVSNVLAGVSALTRSGDPTRSRDANSKSDDWAGSSDDEAIDIRAAASGSQALDERTSATLSANRSSSGVVTQGIVRPRASTHSSRRRRPSNLDLSAIRNTGVPDPEPSPAPTLLTLRQALQQLPPTVGTPDTFDEADDDDDEVDGRISLAQALLESRLPDLPPPGSVQPQEPILLSCAHLFFQEPSNSQPSNGDGIISKHTTTSQATRRRRWSVMLTGSAASSGDQGQDLRSSHNLSQSNLLSPSGSNHQINGHFTRSPSLRSNTLPVPIVQPTPSTGSSFVAVPSSCTSTPTSGAVSISSATPRASRFIPRIISNALNRRSDERPLPISATDTEAGKWLNGPPFPPPAPPPKLEYVKLPGTKGALMIKAVETQKKSFLAILCGENGEKVELFAGTYRTALGLSRTFILPDSPRSLELQLQGDDLVEVFLVFSQNVFGLEPATVRVREVRIGRAERRAARRRARENRTGEAITNENEINEDETNVNVTIGVSLAATGSTTMTTENGLDRSSTPPLIANEHPDAPNEESRQESSLANTTAQEEPPGLLTGSYTTFQQLSFAPNFPLASIADEYIIPPTYPNFLDCHRNRQQDDNSEEAEPSQTQFSPPGLPVPTPMGPAQWYYKDPKGVMHGPWNSLLMQAWYRDGLLPADLPVRREGETEYTLLRDLKLQCVDPAHPFRSAPPLLANTNMTPTTPNDPLSPKGELLPPISLLTQATHFGPPALFFSSRGGHSTAIVDARGRSVLKSRFIWSSDDSQDDPKAQTNNKMGDVKRLEALDVKDRSVLVAMRQGGLEAVDLGDALLRPADQSRTILPTFSPPSNTVNRRPPFVWKIGTPINSSNTILAALSSKGKSGLASLPKKTAIGITKSTMSSQGSIGADFEGDPTEEVLFFGRKEDEIYFCERNAGTFRILRLCPDTNQ